MRVLITRPRLSAEKLADRLVALGFEPVLSPMLEIEWFDDSAPLPADAQAILFTSANGVRALARLDADRRRDVFAVGEATAAAARAEGFRRVVAAEGDSGALLESIRAHRAGRPYRLVHVRGTHRAGNPAERLRQDGHRVTERILYAAHAVETLSDAARSAIADGALGAATFYSARAARAFAVALPPALRPSLSRTAAVALSPRIAGELASVRFETVRIAARKSDAAMIACLDPTGDR